jgi:signal transduction histidine kinase
MLFALPSWRAVLPLVAVGVILLVGSVVLVGRDLTFARTEAEAEVLALAETSALAIQFAPPADIQRYLTGLLKHPAVAMATVYSASGVRTVETRPHVPSSRWLRRFVPSLDEAITACRSSERGTLCLEGDSGYYHNRLAALLIPHAILLAASACLLVVAIVLARGSNRRQLAQLARIVEGATEEGNYSLRASFEGKGPMGELARAINALLEQMQQRDLILRRRTTELEAANRELEAFSYSVSHDLRSPLASIDGFSSALAEFYGDRLDESGKEYLNWIRDASAQMNNLVAGLLQMSRISRSEIHRSQVDLSAIAQSLAESLRQRDPARAIDFRIEPGLIVEGDERLLHAVLENLMSNAYKFTGKSGSAMIAVGSSLEGGRRAYFVKDNGAGFDSTQAARMFTPFQRLHSASEFEGTGIGLATVKRIVERHGGTIWADGKVGHGATFYFTIADSRIAPERTKVSELSGVE